MRPLHSSRHSSRCRSSSSSSFGRILIAPISLGLLLLGSSLASAQGSGANSEGWKWEGSRADEIVGVGFDALIIRPLASIRVGVGAAFLLPATLFSAPGGGRDAVEEAYQFFVGDPAEYAFGRELGDFDY